MDHTNSLRKYIAFAIIPFFAILIAIFAFIKINPVLAQAPTKTVVRSIYLWTSAFDNYSIDFIEKYLETNKISTAIVSSSNKTAFNKLAANLSAKGKKTELLLGSNSILTNTNQVAYFDNLFNGIVLKNITALHLDVEPQALDDYQTRKEYYLNLYVQLLKTAKTYTTQKGIKLSVSIPVYWPEATLKEIYTQADTVYLMAYEITDVESLSRRTKEEFALGKEKTVLGLRANDFATRVAFETYLTKALTKLGTSKAVMHDFTRFEKLK